MALQRYFTVLFLLTREFLIDCSRENVIPREKLYLLYSVDVKPSNARRDQWNVRTFSRIRDAQ